ncbi:hypothetical protein RHSIM_Rhsim02G0078800 [Rhododendron simsii]|uniref:Rx N-terminal domain-containing protein n=1 Tax=Rhododendron simsii TaxID=118357 RepID=A0A834LSH3_RHOSS|nr:hypothetical protein RHSIM_Rhsim02G0078800 [Rhododendron simsii]
MALVAVSSVINSTLVPLLSGEVKLLRNIHTEVASIKAELESIMSFLKDADSSPKLENERAKTWVKQVRALAYQIEDIIDEYILHLAENRKIGNEIKKRADRYGFSSFELGSSSKTEENVHDDPRVASLFIEEDEVVGIESTEEELIHRLLNRESNRTVTSLVDLQDAPLDQLHEDVGNLLHFAILKLRKLQHLIIPQGVKIREGIGHFEGLQTLRNVESNDDLIKELEDMRQLRKLGIRNLKREYCKALCTAIEKMNHLQSLSVWAIGGYKILDLHSLSCPPVSLQHLCLYGCLETLPNWISRLDNLVSLKLIQSGLTGAHAIKALQALPNLLKLEFFNGYNGEQLYFDVGAFPKLKSLYLRGLEGLNSLVIEEGGLPVLKKLQIVCCPQLKEVPSGIRNLRELKSLIFWDVPTKFLDRMQPGIGQDYLVIEHIHSVQFLWYDGGGLFRVYTPQEFQDARESQRLNELEGMEGV